MNKKNIKLFYFSSTGNTLAVARGLSEKLNGVELYSIAQCLKDNEFPKAESVGLLFPVYIAGLPLIVRRFIEKYDFAQTKYIFSVATYGGMDGVAHKQVNKLLEDQGKKIGAAFGLKMPDNYIPFFKKPDPDNVDELLKDVEECLPNMAELILGQKTVPYKGAGFMSLLFSLIYFLGTKQIPKMDKKFAVNTNCNGCGICAKVCPVGDVEIVENRPRWAGHCEHCLACIHWCPQQAITFKKKLWQYHNPKINVSDMY